MIGCAAMMSMDVDVWDDAGKLASKLKCTVRRTCDEFLFREARRGVGISIVRGRFKGTGFVMDF
jgi:hypothetical protein